MKKKLLSILLLIPLLAGCPGNTDIAPMPDDYVPELPEFKDKNVGAVKSDDTYAYFDFYELSDFHGAVNHGEKEIGLAKLSTYFDTKRQNNAGGTFVISSGDMWQGSADSNLTRGTMVTYSMDVMDFDSMTLGNHEFDWTVDWIKNNKGRATFPLLAANLIDDNTGKIADFVSPSTIVERGEYKVGIIGTIGDTIRNTILASAVAGYSFANEISTVTAEAAKLREEGCDIVVWSAHNDAEDLKNKVAGNNIGVDLVFGGHSHADTDIANAGVAYLQTQPYGRSVAHAQLKLNKQTREVILNAHEIEGSIANLNLADDKDILGIQNQYNEKFINPVKNKKLGSVDGELSKSKELANLCVYSMKEEILRHDEYKDHNIIAAFHNKNGGVRKDIAVGNITYGQVYEAFPFDNEIVIVSLKGSVLKSKFIGGNSNVCYWHNFQKSDIKSDQTYEIITTDFLLTNPEYYDGLEYELTYTGLTVRDAVANEIKVLKKVKLDDFKITKKEYQIGY